VSLQTKKIKGCMRTTSSWLPRLISWGSGD